MRTKRSIVILCSIVATLAAISTADAGRQSTFVAATDVSTHDPADANLGDYYVLRFDIPDGIQGLPLRWAILEFYCDVSAKDVDGYVNEIPAVQVFALTSEVSGTLDPNQFELQALPVARNVAVGPNRRVVIDITDIVRLYMKNPAKNHGLIIGSLTGRRDGLFSLQGDSLGSGVVAKITFFN